MKDRNCKCSHLKSEHHHVWWNNYSYCNECHCEKYLRFNRPDKTDKVMMFYGFGLIGMGIIAIFSLIYGTINITQEKLDHSYFTFGEFLDIFLPIAILIIILVILFAIWIFIFEYFNIKNRRNFNDQ